MASRKSKGIQRGSIKHLRKTHANIEILLALFALALLIYFWIYFIR